MGSLVKLEKELLCMKRFFILALAASGILLCAENRADFVPDLSRSDIYLKHLKRVPLSGWWKVKHFSDDRIDRANLPAAEVFTSEYDDSSWGRDLVPGSMLAPFLSNAKPAPGGVDGTYRAWGGVAGFRRGFTLPKINANERVFLHFDDVNGNMTVFINGKRIAETNQDRMDISTYKGPRYEYDFDITDAIKPVGKNQIAIRFYHSGKPVLPWGWGNHNGILGRVYAEVRPSVHARHILVTPRRGLRGADVECILGGNGPADGWSGEFFEWKSGKSVGKFALSGKDKSVSGGGNIADPKAWSCESPFLYGVRIRNGKGEIAGVKRFGLRTFERGNGNFLLNGKPVSLRGITFHDYSPFGYMRKGAVFGFAANQNDMSFRFWKTLRELNINHMRTHSSILQEPMYDWLDEVGILVCDELDYPRIWLKKPTRADQIDERNFTGFLDEKTGSLSADFRRDLTFRLRSLYSHPSVCMFSFGNEIRPDHERPSVNRMFGNLYDFYHGLDRQNRPCTISSGRFWKTGANAALAAKEKHDYVDTHDYSGTVNNMPLGYVQYSLENFLDVLKRHYKTLPPVINGECAYGGNNYYPWAFDKIWKDENALEPDWKLLLHILNEFRTKNPACGMMSYYYIRNAGTKGYIYRRAESAGKSLEKILEIHRKLWPEISGYEALNMFPVRLPDSFYPFDFQWEAGISGKHMKQVSSPCIAVFDYFAPNRFCGEAVKAKVHAVNNSEKDLADACLRVEILGDGTIVSSEKFPLGTIGEGKKKSLDMTLSMPEKPGHYILRYTLSGNGTEHSLRSFELNLRDRSKIFSPIASKRKIALYDASAVFAGMKPYSTVKLLKAFGLNFTNLKSFDHLELFDVLVIGCDSMNKKVAAGGGKIRAFAEKGGRILVFEQNHAGRIPFLPELEYTLSGAGEFSEILQFRHPILSGMDQRDFNCWNQKDMGIYHTFIAPVSRAAVTHGGDCTQWGADNFGMTNAHLKLGKGDVLMTQAEVTKLASSDSSAAQLARNLLETILDDRTQRFASEFTGFPVVGGEKADPADLFSIPLKNAANMGFSDKTARDGKGGWSDQGPANDLHAFPVGRQEFGGILFRIQNPAENGGKSCVIVSKNPSLPFRGESGKIAVDASAKRLFFLHSGAWIGGKDPVGEYVVSYRDGVRRTIPLIPGDNIDDWWGAPSKRLKNAASVWNTSNGGNMVGVYLYTWKNPRPGTPVESILVKSYGNAMIGLLGLTGEK